MPKQGTKMDMKSMMETYRKLSIPGPQHTLLAGLEGTWTTRSRSWTDKDQPAKETVGTCEQKMILGGRFLQQFFKGSMMGQEFTGINIIGYDNHAKKYVSTWIDSMSSGIYYFEGTASPDGRTITQESSYDDPITGPTVWRSVTRIADDNTLEYEMYLKSKGNEEKVMEMTVSRKRAGARKAA